MSDEKKSESTFGADGVITLPEVEVRPYPTIKKGSRGETVAKWQRMIGVTPVDGNFGSGTDAATRKWQSDHGLTSDGVVGVASWAKALEKTSPTGMLALEWNQASPEIPSPPAPPSVIAPVAGAMPLGTGSTTPIAHVPVSTTPPVQQAGMMGDLMALPWWAKLLGVLGIGYGVYYTAEQDKKRHR